MTQGVNPGRVLQALRDVASKLGCFDKVRLGEWKSPPPLGCVFAVWCNDYGPATDGHGLASTTPLLQATARIYVPGIGKDEETWELKLLNAADLYLAALNAGFTLGGLVRNVDLLAAEGERLHWQFGHIMIDTKVSRTADMQINAVFSDEWPQAE